MSLISSLVSTPTIYARIRTVLAGAWTGNIAATRIYVTAPPKQLNEYPFAIIRIIGKQSREEEIGTQTAQLEVQLIGRKRSSQPSLDILMDLAEQTFWHRRDTATDGFSQLVIGPLVSRMEVPATAPDDQETVMIRAIWPLWMAGSWMTQ